MILSIFKLASGLEAVIPPLPCLGQALSLPIFSLHSQHHRLLTSLYLRAVIRTCWEYNCVRGSENGLTA